MVSKPLGLIVYYVWMYTLLLLSKINLDNWLVWIKQHLIFSNNKILHTLAAILKDGKEALMLFWSFKYFGSVCLYFWVRLSAF